MGFNTIRMTFTRTFCIVTLYWTKHNVSEPNCFHPQVFNN